MKIIKTQIHTHTNMHKLTKHETTTKMAHRSGTNIKKKNNLK